MYRQTPELELLLVHPGGPFFRNKDNGSWTIPKGVVERGEDPLETARREFSEETGFEAPEADACLSLGEIRQKGGKHVQAWAFAGDCDPSLLKSNTFELEWPPRSGNKRRFPEVDRADFFGPDEAKLKLNPAQASFVDRLIESLKTIAPS